MAKSKGNRNHTREKNQLLSLIPSSLCGKGSLAVGGGGGGGVSDRVQEMRSVSMSLPVPPLPAPQPFASALSFQFTFRCVLPMTTEMKRTRLCRIFFFFLRIFITISVKQELCQMLKIVYLDFWWWWWGGGLALLSKLIVKMEMLACFNRRDLSVSVCLQQ